MASNSNRVFVSPGVYTSEKDLTFVAQSVGVTTLGLAGETLRGPAFEPIFITNWDEFSSYFGRTSAEKYGKLWKCVATCGKVLKRRQTQR